MPCERPNFGIVAALIIGSFLYMLVFHRLSQSPSADGKILLYFIQICLLFVSDTAAYVAWLSFISFNILNSSASGSTCVVPLSPLQKLLSGIVLPLICIAQLIAFAVAHATIWWLARRWPSLKTRFSSLNTDKWHKSPYIRTLFSLLLFSYNSVASSVLAFFRCVTVPGSDERVVASQPGLSCSSHQYNSARPWIVIILVVVVIGAPLCLLMFLLAHHLRLRRWLCARVPMLSKWINVDDDEFDRRADFSRVHPFSRKFQLRFGIIFCVFKPTMFFFEVVIVTRRAILVGVLAVLANEPIKAYSWLSLVCVICLALHYAMTPYISAQDNSLEALSLFIHAILCIFLTAFNASNRQQSDGSVEYTTGQQSLLGCTIFIPSCIMLYFIIRNRLHRWQQQPLPLQQYQHQQQQNSLQTRHDLPGIDFSEAIKPSKAFDAPIALQQVELGIVHQQHPQHVDIE